MSFTVESAIFAHYLVNPPAEDRSCDIDLKLLNPSGALSLTKESPGFQTRYLLTVSDPSMIGLTSSDQGTVERVVKDLVLAFNLSLSSACLSILQGELQSVGVALKPPETRVTVETTEKEKRITVFETVCARDSFHITMKGVEEVDEKQVVGIVQKITQIGRFGLEEDSPIQLVNLSKALNEYESAMTTFDRLRIFKHLFNGLELSTNWDGKDHTGSLLDSEIALISNVPQSEVSEWRFFYNRTKHVDRTPVDASEYVQGLEKLPSILAPTREACKRVIVNRLTQI